MNSAGHVRHEHATADPHLAVKAAASAHISTTARWVTREQISRRMKRHAVRDSLAAARNAVPPLIETRGYGKGFADASVSDAYRLTDAGWETIEGGKPIWL